MIDPSGNRPFHGNFSHVSGIASRTRWGSTNRVKGFVEVRRLSATGSLLIALAGIIPAAPARAADATGVVTVPSPLAGTVNATMAAMSNAGCNVSSPTVTSVQGTDGYAVDMGQAVSSIVLAPLTADGQTVPTDLDVYFFDDHCAYAGSRATAGTSEAGQPELCTGDVVSGTQQCTPTTPRYAVVTMTSGANTPFTLSWEPA